MAKVAPSDSPAVAMKLVPSSGDTGAQSLASRTVVGSTSFIHLVRHGVRDFFHRSGWYESAPAVMTRKFLRGKVFAVAAMISLVAALFFGEIFAVVQVPSNTELDVILTLVFAIFAFEFLGLALTDALYPFGFFFWMDLVGTASMAFDISYMAGADVRQAVQINGGSSASSQNMIVVRAARAAKLGARAGRISRVLKILRFLPFLLKSEADSQKVKMARVISNQLTNVLSTRVAFLTICVVVVMPLFTLFLYPEDDDSMGTWTLLLALNAEWYHDALASTNSSAASVVRQKLLDEVHRFSDFYSDISHGPFMVLYGDSSGSETFAPRPDILDMSGLKFHFQSPQRLSSSRIVTHGRIRASFDLSTPNQVEAAANIGLICFIIVIMCGFGLVMSSSISVIALQPLERMLSVVRERCKEIFKYTVDLKDGDSDDEEDEEEENHDMEHASEFVLLEKVVEKLAAIANLSATNQEVEVKADMNENEIMVLNWMQGAPVPTSSTTEAMRRGSVFQKGSAHATELGPEGHALDTLRGLSKSSSRGIPVSVLDSLATAHFNPLDLPKEVKIALAAYMVTTAEGSAAWVRSNVREAQLNRFVKVVESTYMSNPFHNFAHALDVEYSVMRFMCMIEARDFLTDVQQFWLLVAAIGHDIGHLGVNNPYLVETAHELAVRYNDRSPLENMHCAKLFQLCTDPSANVFSQVEKEMYKEMRKGIIHAILHTDVTKHNEMIKELGMLYQMNQDAFERLEPATAILQSNNNVQLILNMLLHGSDVGNPMKPWELCHRYAHLCLDEFFAQGDLEKAAGIPVQMLNDRDKVNRPNSQVGFIEFVIAPMVSGMVNIFPQLDSLAENLGQNIQKWAEVWVEESAPGQDVVHKVTARVQKVAATMRALLRSAENA